MKINKLKLMSAVSGIFIFFNSCSEDDGAAEIFEKINATLPSSIVLKNIPAGTFTMGGATVQNVRQLITLIYIQTSEGAVSSPPVSPVLTTPFGSTSITLHSFSA